MMDIARTSPCLILFIRKCRGLWYIRSGKYSIEGGKYSIEDGTPQGDHHQRTTTPDDREAGAGNPRHPHPGRGSC